MSKIWVKILAIAGAIAAAAALIIIFREKIADLIEKCPCFCKKNEEPEIIEEAEEVFEEVAEETENAEEAAEEPAGADAE